MNEERRMKEEDERGNIETRKCEEQMPETNVPSRIPEEAFIAVNTAAIIEIE